MNLAPCLARRTLAIGEAAGGIEADLGCQFPDAQGAKQVGRNTIKFVNCPGWVITRGYK
jgi:hypothetical protein